MLKLLPAPASSTQKNQPKANKVIKYWRGSGTAFVSPREGRGRVGLAARPCSLKEDLLFPAGW